MLKEDTWRFLDHLAWPEFVRRYLVARGGFVHEGMDVCLWLKDKEYSSSPPNHTAHCSVQKRSENAAHAAQTRHPCSALAEKC